MLNCEISPRTLDVKSEISRFAYIWASQAQFSVMRMHVQDTLCLNGYRIVQEKNSVLPGTKKKKNYIVS